MFVFPIVPGILLCVAVLASHGLLDAMTDGGLGVALFWPLSNQRFFLPLRPIPVAPIGRRMFSQRGLTVLVSETVLFLPLWLYALWPALTRRAVTGSGSSGGSAPSRRR